MFDFFECFISLYFIFLFASRKQPLHWYRRTAATINIFYCLLSAPAFYFCCCTALKYARIFLSSFAFSLFLSSLLLTQGHTTQKQNKNVSVNKICRWRQRRRAEFGWGNFWKRLVPHAWRKYIDYKRHGFTKNAALSWELLRWCLPMVNTIVAQQLHTQWCDVINTHDVVAVTC